MGDAAAHRLAAAQQAAARADDVREAADRVLALEVQRKYDRLDARREREFAADEKLARDLAEAESAGAAATAKAEAKAANGKDAAQPKKKKGFRSMVFGQ